MSSSLIIQHCQFIALNGCLLILPASFLSSHTDLTDLTDSFSLQQRVFSFGLNGKTPKESKIREIREIRVGKIQHLTFKINHYESKLEIRHQFRHHCPHRRPQHLLHAELQVIASEHELHESNESYLFKGHIRVIRDIRVQLNICSKDIFVSFEIFVFS